MKSISSTGLVVFGMVVAAGLVAASWTASRMMIRLERENELAVKGYAETRVHSDRALLTVKVTAAAVTLPESERRLTVTVGRVSAKLIALGFGREEIDNSVITITKIQKRAPNGEKTNQIEGYQLQQTVSVRTAKVKLVGESLPQLASLLGQGLDIAVEAPEYYVSDLEKFKLDLIRVATENARQRAVAIAASSGGKISQLISARQGVFQVTAPDSAEISDYGVYDTRSAVKVAKVVMTLKFRLD